MTTKKRKSIVHLRYQILERDHFTCQICGKTPPEIRLEVDHIKPIAEGGTNDPSNLRASCYECNRGRGILTLLSTPHTTRTSKPHKTTRKPTDDVNAILEDIQSLGSGWFGIGHGIDNCEEAYRTSEIAAFYVSYKYLPPTDFQERLAEQRGQLTSHIYWDITLQITMRSGTQLTSHLSPQGYDAFLRALKHEDHQSSKTPEPVMEHQCQRATA